MWRDLSVYSVDIVKCCYCRDLYLLIVVFDVFLNSRDGLFSVSSVLSSYIVRICLYFFESDSVPKLCLH